MIPQPGSKTLILGFLILDWPKEGEDMMERIRKIKINVVYGFLKSEILNPKLETNSKSQIRILQTIAVWNLEFEIWDLFRISNFEFRISDFGF